MDQKYRETTRKLEQAGVHPDYLIGWQGGYLRHPKREEQRLSEAYEAGYEHGAAHDDQSFGDWCAK